MSGNVKLALSHVVPDLVLKVLKGQDPLHILGEGNQVRHYTYGGDLAQGIRIAMESPAAVNDDFNLSTAASTTVLELAETIWGKVHGRRPAVPFVSDPPFEHDVQLRVPDVRKAREVLGFEATTTLDADARRGHPLDPRRARGRPPVSDDRAAGRAGALDRPAGLQRGRGGRARPPGLSAGVSTPHEIVVVYDFDGDTTVPVIDRLAREIPGAPRAAQRPRPWRPQRHEGRASPGPTAPYVLISMADGSDEPHVVDRMVALARGRRCRRGVALHARRPADRRAAAQAADEPRSPG